MKAQSGLCLSSPLRNTLQRKIFMMIFLQKNDTDIYPWNLFISIDEINSRKFHYTPFVPEIAYSHLFFFQISGREFVSAFQIVLKGFWWEFVLRQTVPRNCPSMPARETKFENRLNATIFKDQQ